MLSGVGQGATSLKSTQIVWAYHTSMHPVTNMSGTADDRVVINDFDDDCVLCKSNQILAAVFTLLQQILDKHVDSRRINSIHVSRCHDKSILAQK